MAADQGDPGLHRRLGGEVAMTDGEVVVALGCEAARAVAVDRPDALVIEPDVPDPRCRPCEGNAWAECWLQHAGLDSLSLGSRTPATEGREQQVLRTDVLRFWGTWWLEATPEEPPPSSGSDHPT